MNNNSKNTNKNLFLRDLGKTGVHSTDNYTCSYRFFYWGNSVMEFSGNIVNSMYYIVVRGFFVSISVLKLIYNSM